ncbi:[protein-PII] uridylyltransferase [bacterium]|nr:[protein-PII] uridylyltransferase [bacterium]
MTYNSKDSVLLEFGDLTDRALDTVAREFPYRPDSQNIIRQSLTAYRKALKHVHAHIEQAHDGGAAGHVVCAMLSERIDRLILHVCRFFSQLSPDTMEYAIIALGGYGRRELNPCSDIDLLFLSDKPFAEAGSNSIRTLLQFLWDMNLDIGHSTRSMEECMDGAREDIYLATSLLEARFLAGNSSLWEAFRSRFSQWLHDDSGKQLAMRKIDERIQRLEFYHRTVQIQQPNIKECPGTLRDIHTARWLLQITERGNTLDEMVTGGLFSAHEKDAYEAGLDFLLRVRNSLHFLTGKKTDILDHLILPEVAKNLRYSGEGVSPVESFMRDYYMHVGRIRQLTDRIVEKFFIIVSGTGDEPYVTISENLRANGKKVALIREENETLAVHPKLLIEIFIVAGARGVNIKGSTSSLIEKNLPKFEGDLSGYSEIIAAFHNLINIREGVGRALRLMHEHGVLIKLIPEFEPICWHYQYDFYHMYTTDEHSLRVVENLEGMYTGKRTGDPELSVLMQDVTARSALYLAGLLHDIGKADGASHSKRGERMAARVLKRLSFDERTLELVQFLIRDHLLMSHVSQRRDIEDKDTVSDFIEHVGSAGRLRMLTLLTFADLLALSPDALTDWKRALIWNLYKKALMLIDRGFERTARTTRKSRIRDLADKFCGDFPRQKVREHLGNLPEQYLRVTMPAAIRKHLKGIESMKKRGAWASFHHKGKLTMLTVIAPDYPKALSDICGAITSSDINIVGAQIFTRNDGIIIDTFLVVNENAEALITPEKQHEFKRNLPQIIAGKIDVKHLIQSHIRRWKRRRKNVVYYPPRVKFYNDISSQYTVIDVFATDYTGLLYDITSILGENGIDIHTAKIGTDEDQVADAFYIRKDGVKIEDEAIIGELTAGIIGRLTRTSQ